MTASTDASLTMQTILTAAGCLIGVIALILLLARLTRHRLLTPGQGKALQLRESLAIDTKRRIHLIECEGTRVILLTGGGRDQVIARIGSQ